MKKELENIHEIMKENMGRLEGRRQSLEETEEKARLISEESKRFEQTTNKLVWTYWIRNNLVWLVVAVALILIYFLIF
jgi:sugar phosphate permease